MNKIITISREYSSRKQKVDLILPRQPAFVALCQIAAAGNLYLEYRTNVPARL